MNPNASIISSSNSEIGDVGGVWRFQDGLGSGAKPFSEALQGNQGRVRARGGFAPADFVGQVLLAEGSHLGFIRSSPILPKSHTLNPKP